MFETSAIEEVQQENVVRDNPNGASNEQGAMIGKHDFFPVHVSMCYIREMHELFFFLR